MDLSVTLPGFNLKNPILTASGTFGYGLEFSPYGDLRELGGIVVKGLSLEPKAGNPMPRLAETPCGMLNSIGLQNIGVKTFIEDRLPLLPWRDTPVIINIYACSVDDFAALGRKLAVAEGVAALEVNVSCPNVSAGGSLFGQDAAMAAAVTKAVKKVAKKVPVWVKLSPNVTDIVSIAKAVEDAGADALVCINTLSGMSVDLKSLKPRLANVIGGLSGPAIKPVALRCVYQVASAVNIPVIGVGGIRSAKDVLEFILVGAHAVQIGTATFTSPDHVFRLVHELPQKMRAMGLKSLTELRGQLRV